MISFFKNKAAGIYISDRVVEIVSLEKSGDKISLKASAGAVLAPGIVEHGVIKNKQALLKPLRGVLHALSGAKRIFVGLPDNLTYYHRFFYAPAAGKTDDDAVKKEAVKTFPIDGDDLVYSYACAEAAGGGKSITVVAASAEVLAEWKSFFAAIGIAVNEFDTEAEAAYRALAKDEMQYPVCVFDFSAFASKISIFDGNGIFSSRSIPVSGDSIANDVALSLKLSADEAKKRIMAAGLSGKKPSLMHAIVKSLEKIAKELGAETAMYKKAQKSGVKEIVCAGEFSAMPGLSEYFQANLEIPTRIGKTYVTIKGGSGYFGTAAGLAVRAWDKTGLILKVSNKTLSMNSRKNKHDTFNDWLSGNAGKKETRDLEFPIKKRSPHGKMLVLAVLSGLAIIGGAYFVLAGRGSSGKVQTAAKNDEFSLKQTLKLKILIALHSVEYADGRIKGRVIEDTVRKAGSYSEAVALSSEAVESALGESEQIWGAPLNEPKDSIKAELPFPYTFEWMVFNGQDVTAFAKNKVDNINSEGAPLKINSIEFTKLERTRNPNLVYMLVDAKVSLNSYLDVPDAGLPDIVQESPVSTVKITDTETGYLNVRSGPGTSNKVLRRINPGEEYTFLKKNEDNWVQILLPGGGKGWVSGKYVDILGE